MKTKRVPIKTVSNILAGDALFVMAFCLWWAYTANNVGINWIGIMAGFALLDLGKRAEGEAPFPAYFVFTVWGFLVIVVLYLVLASLGLANDVFGLLNK